MLSKVIIMNLKFHMLINFYQAYFILMCSFIEFYNKNVNNYRHVMLFSLFFFIS